MNPQDPKSNATKSTNPTPFFTNCSGKSPERPSASPNPSATLSLGNAGDCADNASYSSSKASYPSSASISSSTRPNHTLYSSATPPLSPARSLLSPYQKASESNQHSSGFYQLPPPLQQPLHPNDAPHYSPKMVPQQIPQSSLVVGGARSLPLPSPRPTQPGNYSNMSPQSNPQRSPRMNHSLSSPFIGPLSPYPTPQHYPQHQSSPHQSPRYESNLKQPIPPNMLLPAPSLSSTSVFQVLSPRSFPSPYSSGQHPKSPASHPTQLKSPQMGISQRSIPSSPQRFMMLPPQTAPTMASARQAKANGGAGSKRRASSSDKVDQETREMMRKVSHSAIERRRRERINDKILQLKCLVPACVDEDHLHKLSILQSTIEYIQYLKSVIPESIANAKFQKATNSNPNNKTTDMLDALNSANSTIFTPMMTTGLGYPYSKRARTEQAINTQHSSSSGTIHSLPSVPKSSVVHDPRRVSARQPSSDEDAKDGLLLLSQMSSGALSTTTSPSLVPELEPEIPNDGELGASHGISAQTFVEECRNSLEKRKRRCTPVNVEDKYEEDETQQEDSDMSDELDDEDYQDEDKAMSNGKIENVSLGETGRRHSGGKMSVERMLC